MFASTTAQSPNLNPNQYEVPHGPTNSVSCIAWSKQYDYILTSDWNGEMLCWEVTKQNLSFLARPLTKSTHEQPLLSVDMTLDRKIITGGCDKTVKMLDVTTGNNITQIGQHESCVKVVKCTDDPNFVMSGSWDKTIKFWDLRARSNQAAATINLPERCYDADITQEIISVACAERHLPVYDQRRLPALLKKYDSQLKFQTRCIANWPNKQGFSIGSIEGRLANHTFSDVASEKKFTFKCHRTFIGNSKTDQNVYPVNAITFHPQGQFATVGGDGTVSIWDNNIRSRTKAFERVHPTLQVTTGKFNRDGSILAYAVGNDFSLGAENVSKEAHVYLHMVEQSDITKKK
jgi:mRNA export factor